MRPRKVPVRTCVSCRESGEKRGLLRVVRTPSGEIVIDRTGKLAGRGAYLCGREECLRRTLKEKRLQRALKTEIPEEIIRELEEIIKQGTEDM
ncbi:MAG: RNase P modulator RnpM [Armatimonadota bacterium]